LVNNLPLIDYGLTKVYPPSNISPLIYIPLAYLLPILDWCSLWLYPTSGYPRVSGLTHIWCLIRLTSYLPLWYLMAYRSITL